MTMQVTITHDGPDHYHAFVEVFDNGVKVPHTETFLTKGQSASFYIHNTKHIKISEVTPIRIADA